MDHENDKNSGKLRRNTRSEKPAKPARKRKKAGLPGRYWVGSFCLDLPECCSPEGPYSDTYPLSSKTIRYGRVPTLKQKSTIMK